MIETGKIVTINRKVMFMAFSLSLRMFIRNQRRICLYKMNQMLNNTIFFSPISTDIVNKSYNALHKHMPVAEPPPPLCMHIAINAYHFQVNQRLLSFAFWMHARSVENRPTIETYMERSGEPNAALELLKQ